jgi:hypothetical protein
MSPGWRNPETAVPSAMPHRFDPRAPQVVPKISTKVSEPATMAVPARGQAAVVHFNPAGEVVVDGKITIP